MDCFRAKTELLEIDCEAYVYGAWGQALFVVAGLEAEFAGHHGRTRVGAGERFKSRGNLEITAKYRDRIGRESVFLELRLGVSDLLGFERLFRPGELQGNKKLIGRRVTVDVKTGLELGLELYFGRGSALDGELFSGRNAQYRIILRC